MEKTGEVQRIAGKYGASNLRIFGSVLRGESRNDSDLDLLVDLEPGRSLLDLGGLVYELQELLKRRVDVVTEKGLHWYIHDQVLREARPL